VKILLVPDLHLGAGTSIGKDLYNTGLNSRIEDQKKLLEFTYQTAKENNINRLVVLGDLWDSPKPTPAIVHVFLEWLMKCVELYNVDIVQGNHDFIRSGSNKISMINCIKLLNINNCNIFTEIDCVSNMEEKLNMIYIPFTDREQIKAKTTDEAKIILQSQIKTILNSFDRKYKNICFGHLALEGSFWVGNESVDDYNEIFITKKMIQDLKIDYTFMGHVHNPQVINKNPFMAHIGSLDKTKFTGPDATDKHLTIYDTKTNEIKNIKLPCRNLIDITISIPKTEKDETNYIINNINLSKEKLKNSIVRIKIESNSSEYKYVDRKRINDELDIKGVFNVSSIIETKHKEQVLKTNIGIDEHINHDKAIDIFINTISGSDDFKRDVKNTCKKIIKEVCER